AGLVATALAALTWALSQIGRGEPRAATPPDMTTVAVGVFGLAGLGVYVLWERVSAHPMTPPRLAESRVFVGLNAATLLIYAGLSIMFFLLPFDLVDRRGLSPTSAGLVLLPFTLAVGLLSQFFGGLANRFGAGLMLVVGAGGASIAYVWMAVAQDALLMFGVIRPGGHTLARVQPFEPALTSISVACSRQRRSDFGVNAGRIRAWRAEAATMECDRSPRGSEPDIVEWISLRRGH